MCISEVLGCFSPNNTVDAEQIFGSKSNVTFDEIINYNVNLEINFDVNVNFENNYFGFLLKTTTDKNPNKNLYKIENYNLYSRNKSTKCLLCINFMIVFIL
jgi:hypothetical protein